MSAEACAVDLYLEPWVSGTRVCEFHETYLDIRVALEDPGDFEEAYNEAVSLAQAKAAGFGMNSIIGVEIEVNTDLDPMELRLHGRPCNLEPLF